MKAWMLTMPRFLGYSFNPLTVYYIYDPTWIATLLEVHNTFGEKHVYVVPRKETSIPRRFHVSPFNDREGTYQFQVSPPPEINIKLTLVTPEAKPKLVATLTSQNSRSIHDGMSVFWLCVLYGWWIFLTMPRILWEAWRLHYRMKLPVYMRPEPFQDQGTIHRQMSSSTDLYISLEFSYIDISRIWLSSICDDEACISLSNVFQPTHSILKSSKSILLPKTQFLFYRIPSSADSLATIPLMIPALQIERYPG